MLFWRVWKVLRIISDVRCKSRLRAKSCEASAYTVAKKERTESHNEENIRQERGAKESLVVWSNVKRHPGYGGNKLQTVVQEYADLTPTVKPKQNLARKLEFVCRNRSTRDAIHS